MNFSTIKSKIVQLFFWFTIFASSMAAAMAQSSVLLRSCAGTNPTIKEAKIEVTKDGAINIIPCFGQTVRLNGNVLNGTGTVISVGLTIDGSIYTISAPITTSGNLTATLANQTANTVWAAPNGATGKPGFRVLYQADIPALDAGKITTGTFLVSQIPALDAGKITTGTLATARIPALDASQITTGSFTVSQIPNLDAAKIATGTIAPARLGTGTPTSSTVLKGDGTWGSVSGGSITAVNYLNVGAVTTTSADYANTIITCANATLTIPSSIPIGGHAVIMSGGSCVLKPPSSENWQDSDTINTTGSNTTYTIGYGGLMEIIKSSSGNWVVVTKYKTTYTQ